MNKLKTFLKSLVSSYWTIGFSDRKTIEELKFEDVKWIKGTLGEWFADPFILDYDDNTITVLVEYVINPDPLGKIAKFVIDRKSLKIISKTIILDLATHLSFPAILRRDNGVYIYPENSASGELNLYKLNDDATGCEKVCTLVKAPITDAIIFEHEGEFIMTATIEPESNGNLMQIYTSKNVFGPYALKAEKYLSNNTARNAGYTLSKSDGLYYKISQENDVPIYGHGMVFYEASPDMEYMKEVNRVVPQNGFIGVHTMNPYKDLIVWDAKKYRCPFCVSLIQYMSFLKKLFR